MFSLQANEMVQAQIDFLAALNVLNKTRSQLSYATNTEKRLHDLYDSRVTTLKEWQTAQNDLTTAQNDAKTAEVGLEAVPDGLRLLGLADDAMEALQTKGAIALELLDQVRGEGLPAWLALADAGYGVSEEFRNGLAARGLKYLVGVTDEMVVFTEEPTWELPGPADRDRKSVV